MCIGDIMQESQGYNNFDNELDEELTIDLKKIFLAIWSRKYLIVKVFVVVLLIFVGLTFILPKKYTVEADLYINKSNATNLAEFNPYAIESQVEDGFSLTASNKLANEIELIKSPLVMQKVINENDIKYRKVFGIFTTKKTGKLIPAQRFNKKGKNPSFESIKGTNVLRVRYTAKKPELAYNVVNSIISNYIDLQQSLNTEKSKSDKAILEKEYNKAKVQLNEKLSQSSGLPASAVSGMGNISAMSAFSASASKAIGNLKGQFISGKRSEIEVTENATKAAQLASKLEWARIVAEMSDNSKVLVINPPLMPEVYDQSSPKLLINILLGIVFGAIAALFALIFAETTSKKLTYSMLGDNVVYNFMDNLTELKMCFLANKDSNIALVAFDDAIEDVKEQYLGKYTIISADITDEFVNSVKNYDKIILFEKVNSTDSKLYKNIITILKDLNKNILKEVLVK